MTGQPEPWFEPKPNGYGAGKPIHRNGWIALGLYTGGMVLSALVFLVALPAAFGLMIPRTYGTGWTMPDWALFLFMSLWLLLAVAPLTVGFMRLARARTAGGWRHRTGGRDTAPPWQ